MINDWERVDIIYALKKKEQPWPHYHDNQGLILEH